MGMVEDVYLYLTTGTATVSSTKTFVNLLPSEPDAVVGLIEQMGFASVRVFNRNLPQYQRMRLQVVVRATTSDSGGGRALADTIWQQLVKVGNQTLAGASSGYTYLRIDDAQAPQYIGRDERGRPLFSCNYDVWPLR